eukprot:scaffold78_cov609-Prasinococcus_capsulatus_cf.AAC.8
MVGGAVFSTKPPTAVRALVCVCSPDEPNGVLSGKAKHAAKSATHAVWKLLAIDQGEQAKAEMGI